MATKRKFIQNEPQSLAGNATESNRAEEALQESEEPFRALIENSSDAIAILNSVGDGATFTVGMPIVQEQISDEQVDLTVPWGI